MSSITKKNKEMSWDKNHQYGIFARINNRPGWDAEQVKLYMDKQNIPYRKNDNLEQLVERLKCHEDKKYK